MSSLFLSLPNHLVGLYVPNYRFSSSSHYFLSISFSSKGGKYHFIIYICSLVMGSSLRHISMKWKWPCFGLWKHTLEDWNHTLSMKTCSLIRKICSGNVESRLWSRSTCIKLRFGTLEFVWSQLVTRKRHFSYYRCWNM